MNWWQTLTGTRPGLPGDISFKLKAYRFHSIIRNQRSFNNLIDDAIEKLGGGYVIDRQYLVSLVDKAFALATQIVCDTNVLHDGTDHYKEYFRLDSLKSNLRHVLAWQPQVKSGELVLPLSEIDELDHYHLAGGVFTRLAELKQRLGLLAPEGVVISVAAFNLFVEYNGLERLMAVAENRASSTMDELRMKIKNAVVPPEVLSGVNRAVSDIAGSDAGSTRFVLNAAAFGQEYNHFTPGGFQTAAGIGTDAIATAYKSLVASLYSPLAVSDRIKTGLPARCFIAVAVSRMICARFEGTIHTVAPEAPHWDRMRITVNAGHGTGKEPPELEVSRHAPYNIRSSSGESSPLPSQLVAGLAEKAMRIERYFKGPQEVKWTVDENGDTFIIHSRPLDLEAQDVVSPEELAQAVSSYETIFDQSGNVASPGISYGTVYLADNNNLIENIPERSVLVADYLEPGVELLQALSNAAAILMNRGGQAGHVASLAREFHVPAIVGLGDVTKRLSQGDVVTVDADDNVVYRGLVQELMNYQLSECLDLDVAREYILLRFVLHRLSSKNIAGSVRRRARLKSRETLDQIVRFSLDTACRDISDAMQAAGRKLGESAVRIQNAPGLKLHLLNVGGSLDNSTAEKPSPAGKSDFNSVCSRPLSCFWTSLENTGFKFPREDSGSAIASGEFFLMNIVSGARVFFIDAAMSGELEHDYIYIRVSDTFFSSSASSRQTMWLKEILKRFGFTTYIMNDGFTAWKYEMTTSEMEQNLRMLGAMFAYAQAGAARDEESVEAEIEKFMETKKSKLNV